MRNVQLPGSVFHISNPSFLKSLNWRHTQSRTLLVIWTSSHLVLIFVVPLTKNLVYPWRRSTSGFLYCVWVSFSLPYVNESFLWWSWGMINPNGQNGGVCWHSDHYLGWGTPSEITFCPNKANGSSIQVDRHGVQLKCVASSGLSGEPVVSVPSEVAPDFRAWHVWSEAYDRLEAFGDWFLSRQLFSSCGCKPRSLCIQCSGALD